MIHCRDYACGLRSRLNARKQSTWSRARTLSDSLYTLSTRGQVSKSASIRGNHTPPHLAAKFKFFH